MTSNRFVCALIVVLCSMAAAPAFAADATPASAAPPAGKDGAADLNDPLKMLDRIGNILPDAAAPAKPKDDAFGGAGPVADKTAGGGLSTSISILILLTLLSIAPALLVLCTSFTRIVIVLSLLRQAIGTQSLPPSQVIVGLSLFLTFLVMAPTFDRVNKEAIGPLQRKEIDSLQAWEKAKQPLRDFMFDQIDHSGNWDDLYMILDYRGVKTPHNELKRADVDMLCLIPAFILSELKVAFLMGFRLYLPFLIIDMVISSVLLSMGMMMLPPVLVSLPFKLLLFVLVDGWRLVAGSLLHSFAVSGAG